MVQFEYVVYEISDEINGMIRSPNDGVHLETPQAQTGSSSEGVRSATSGNTPCATSPAENSIPGPTSIDDPRRFDRLATRSPTSKPPSMEGQKCHEAKHCTAPEMAQLFVGALERGASQLSNEHKIFIKR